MDTLDRIPLKSLGVVECQREHVDDEDWPPRTISQRALDAVKFIVFGTMVVAGAVLMSIGLVVVWLYCAVML